MIDCVLRNRKRAISLAGERLPYTEEVRGSNPLSPTLTISDFRVRIAEYNMSEIRNRKSAIRLITGVVVQLVRTPACHAGGREFEPRRPRQRST